MCFYYPQLEKAGVQTVGLSVDTQEYARQFEKKVLNELPQGKVPGLGKEGFPFVLLCDTDKEVIQQFGLVDSNSPMGVIALPATLFIDSSGSIGWIYESRVASERPSVEDILEHLNK